MYQEEEQDMADIQWKKTAEERLAIVATAVQRWELRVTGGSGEDDQVRRLRIEAKRLFLLSSTRGCGVASSGRNLAVFCSADP
jgi:hypothetical protein